MRSQILKFRAGERAHAVITGSIVLDIAGDIGVTGSRYDEKSGEFRADVEKHFQQYVHLTDNAATLQIGANEGQEITLVPGDEIIE